MSAGQRVLIIDDEIDLMQMVAFVFKSNGFQVMTANSAKEALEKAHGFKPQLIILDLNMPEMGGVEFYSKICDPMGNPLYPVLVLTAQTSAEQGIKALKVKGFMRKPFDIGQLLEAARSILSQSPQSCKRIFIADDDKDMVFILQTTLEKQGFEVKSAGDGIVALKVLQQYVPDAMIIDLTMPSMSGWHLCMKLRHDERFRHIPIIILSGLVSEEGAAHEFGPNTVYMLKPFDIFKLVDQIKQMCGS